MPSSCCAVNCSNRSKKDSDLKFYNIPVNSERRKSWLIAIRRENWTQVEINNARLCGEHFVSGKKSDDPSNVNYVPTIFEYNKRKREKTPQNNKRVERRLKRQKLFDVAQSSKSLLDHEHEEQVNEEIVETDAEKIARLECEVKQLKTESEELKKDLTTLAAKVKCTRKDNQSRTSQVLKLKAKLDVMKKNLFRYTHVKKDSKMHLFYTGVSANVFKWIIKHLEAKIISKQLVASDHLFLVLIKLRLGLRNKDLGYRFGISFSVVSRIYREWLPKLAKLMTMNVIFWPEKIALRKNLPKCFRKKYSKCICIIDCTEVFIERPLGLNARAQTWSNYKNTNTIKYLVACTPAGAVSFLSEGWGGRVSDKEITIKSGFLELIECGDQILADCGFIVRDEIATKGGILEIPSFTKGKSQLSAAEVDRPRQIANVRIHIERVIGRLRKFNILNTTIPIKQVDLLDDVMVSVSGLVNLCGGIV